MKKILLVFWGIFVALAGSYLWRYLIIAKKFSPSFSQSWIFYNSKNSRLNIVFPNRQTADTLKKYLPMHFSPATSSVKGKFFFLNGSNGWHHLTKKFLDDFYPEEKFTLILIDGHPDAATVWKNEGINCGNWLNFIRQPVIFLGGSIGFDEELNRFLNTELIAQKKLKIYSARHFSFYLKSRQKLPKDNFFWITTDSLATFFGFPGYYICTYSLDNFYHSESVGKIYISIDLDVLSTKYIRTGYGNGLLSLSELEKLLDFLFQKNTVVGIDLCGISPESDEKSRQTWLAIFTYILKHLNI